MTDVYYFKIIFLSHNKHDIFISWLQSTFSYNLIIFTKFLPLADLNCQPYNGQ